MSTNIVRPYGVVIGGSLQLGVELVFEDGAIAELRPHTGLPEPYVISPAFINAHSHLEYRGLQGKLHSEEYFYWLREITEAKKGQSLDQVREDCFLAARENRATGVARIAEHSDRPFAGEALAAVGIDGVIYQELITFFESANPRLKLQQVQHAAESQRESFLGSLEVGLHTAYTVDRNSLEEFGHSGARTSIHVAESVYENLFFRNGEGPIADFYRRSQVPFEPTGKSVVEYLESIGLTRPEVQFVHCCDLSPSDIEILVSHGVSVAHCPRSNTRLRCLTAPVREMLDAGIKVGLGLDSAASSGPIDMFAEMRAALEVSMYRGKPLTSEEVWSMATTKGNAAIGMGAGWDLFKGTKVPLIKIHIDNVNSTEDLIVHGSPERVEWVC